MNVNYVNTSEKAADAISELKRIPKLCLDTETTGLQAGIARPRLLQLCEATPNNKQRDIYVFDLFKISASEEIKELIATRELLIMHNANFDYQFLLYMGIDYRNKIFDTYIAERVLRSGFKEKKYSPKIGKEYYADVSCSLKAVAERRLGLELDKEQQISDWSKDDLEMDQIIYSAKDVDILPDIAADQIAELKEENLMHVYGMESKCIRPVARMCSSGFGINVDKLQQLKARIEEKLEAKVKEFVRSLDDRLPEDMKLPRDEEGGIAIGVTKGTKQKKFNPGSTKQVINACQACGIALPVDSKTNKPVLNQIALAEFDSQDPTILLYREQTKLQTEKEHVEKLLSNVNPITHRIHSGYNQIGANSGRFTSSGATKTKAKEKKSVFAVNIQQIPRSKEFRSCFIPEKGFKLVICDWSQIELRLGAQLINIPQMRQAFNKQIDLHNLTASLIYKIPIEDVTDDLRQEGKTLNFALLYGMGYRKYKTYSAQGGKIISLSDAKVAHAGFHGAYPRLRAWHQERAALVQDGWAYVRTALGRRRLLSYDDATMMCSANTLIQGSGADILKIAIAKLDEYLNDEVKLVACIHDELVLEVKEELAENYKQKLETIMIEAAKTVLTDVPSKADAKVGSSWADK
jgi:DNA polymerase I-like protein with 3'-5' exonuclease and polymerase domains